MTIYYVVHDYNTLERTGFMVITIPLKNINKLLDTSYEGTWLALEERTGGVICSDIPDNPDLESRLEELPYRVTRTENR